MTEDIQTYDEFLKRWRQCPDNWKRFAPPFILQQIANLWINYEYDRVLAEIKGAPFSVTDLSAIPTSDGAGGPRYGIRSPMYSEIVKMLNKEIV